MFAGREFPPFEDQGARLLGIDIGKLLASDEAISSVTSRLRTLSGNDALPQNHLPVAPQFSGSQLQQLVEFNDPPAFNDPSSLVGNRYALSFSATTSASRVLMPWSRFDLVRGFGLTGYTSGGAPAAAQSVMLTGAPLFFILPLVQGGFVGQDFPIANQTEKLAYGFDYSSGLSPGETITSATAFLALIEGTDNAVLNDATVYSIGSPAISGNVVTQMLAWPGFPDLTANVYALNIAAVTSFNQNIAAWARIVIDAVK